MRILVTYAVRGELTELDFPGWIGKEEVEIGYLCTGIGKMKSAFHVTEAFRHLRPDLVINLGTAGSLTHKVGEILVCRRFIDRDLRKLTALALESEIDSSDLLELRGYCLHWPKGGGICNTGDSFLTESVALEGDVVDMEAYAQAYVCRERGVPFISVKYVTDIIGQNSVQAWEEKLADARKALGEFFKQTGGVIPAFS